MSQYKQHTSIALAVWLACGHHNLAKMLPFVFVKLAKTNFHMGVGVNLTRDFLIDGRRSLIWEVRLGG